MYSSYLVFDSSNDSSDAREKFVKGSAMVATAFGERKPRTFEEVEIAIWKRYLLESLDATWIDLLYLLLSTHRKHCSNEGVVCLELALTETRMKKWLEMGTRKMAWIITRITLWPDYLIVTRSLESCCSHTNRWLDQLLEIVDSSRSL